MISLTGECKAGAIYRTRIFIGVLMYSNIVWIAAGYIAGILALHIGIDFFGLLLWAFFLAVLMIIRNVILKQPIFLKCLILLSFVLGATGYICATDITLTDSYPFLDKYAVVRGRISELPVVYTHENENENENENEDDSDNEEYYEYVVDIFDITYRGQTIKSHDRVRIGSECAYDYGDTIIAEGFFDAIENRTNPNAKDSQLYYKSHNIFYDMSALKMEPWGRKYFPLTPHHFSNLLFNKISHFIDAHYTGHARAFMKAVFVGDKTQFDDDYDSILEQAGAKRLLYSTFLHIVMIEAALAILFSIFPVKSKHRDILLAVFLVLYMLINDTGPVFLKLPLFILLSMYRRNTSGYLYVPSIIAAVILLVIMIEPLYLFHCGFIISAVSTILLFLFFEPLQKRLRFISNARLRRLITGWIILTIGTFPLSMYWFNGSAMYTILCTLFFAPLVVLLFFITPFVFLLMICFHHASVFGLLQGLILWTMDKVPMLINQLPGGFLCGRRPSLNMIALFYATLILVKLIIDNRGNRFSIIAARTAIVGLSVTVVFGMLTKIGVLQMTFVNVGQGDAAVLHVPFRDTVLIDGGGAPVYSDYNVGKEIFVPYLYEEGFFRIDAAIVSHYHKDHCEGIVEAVKNMRVKKLIMPACTPDNEYRVMLEEAALKYGTEIVYISGETTITFRSGLNIHIIYPNRRDLDSEDANDTSIVAEVTYGDVSALFTGDITETAEERLLDRGLLRKEDVLKVPHHGSANSSSEEFVQAIHPDYAVIGVGADNGYDMPSKERVDQYEENGAFVLPTSLYGDITFMVTKQGIKRINISNTAGGIRIWQ